MGLLKALAFPLTGPLWVARTVRDEAERQYYDTASIRQQLQEVEQQYAAGQIEQEEYERLQEQLLQRLLDAREYHRGKRQDG
jgi:cytochrome c-type biogenesis protein CcmI